MKVLSLYCGAGGLDEGLKQAGIKTTVAIDNDADCWNTMKKNHPDCEVIYGDVGSIINSLDHFDIVVGGPPCPEFSRANPDRLYDLCEVNKFWDAVQKTKPKHYLMENVVDMRKYLRRKQILINCADYGVPQTRTRRFFTNLPGPIPTHDREGGTVGLFTPPNPRKCWVTMQDILNLAPNEKHIIDMKFTGKNKIMLTTDVSKPCPTLTTINNFKFVEDRIFSKKYTGIAIDPKQGRALTNEEAALLQGFSKDYKFYGSTTSVRKQIGNAVPPPVIKAFFNQEKLVTIEQ